MEVISREVRTLLRDVERAISDRSLEETSCESMLLTAERIHRLIVLLIDALPVLENCLPLIETVVSILSEIHNHFTDVSGSSVGMSLFQFRSGGRGRPQVIISQPVLGYLIGHGFAVRHIALLLQTSPSTIRRHLRRYGLSVRNMYSTIGDVELGAVISRIQQQHPNCGYRMMRGHLMAMGVRVQESRVKESLRRVDPIGVANRWIQSIHRRTYSVPSPNALWHMDGNHKLIRYPQCIID